MGKSRIKSLRNITVDDEDYKWMVDDSYNLKIWKDKKLVYQSGWDSHEKYPQVYYNFEDGITPRIVAKIIGLINGTEDLISTEDFEYRFESDFAIGYYDKHASFEDKRVEHLFYNLNIAKEKLEEYLKEKKVSHEL